MAQVRIGVSGWRYPPWRGVSYPRELPQRLELQYASSIFPTLEINGPSITGSGATKRRTISCSR